MLSTTKHLVRLGLPITVGRTGVIGMGITDLIVVGQLAGDELAHLSLALILIGVLVHGGIALLLGVQVTSARARGADDLPLAGLAWRRGLAISLLAGALLCIGIMMLGDLFFDALGVDASLAAPAAAIAGILSLSIPMHLLFIASTNFLEGLERPTPGAIAMWSAVLLNLVLNLLLVPIWGARGSAWTTVASRTFLAVAIVAFILRDESLRPALARSASVVSFRALIGIGASAMVSSIVEAGAFSAMGVIAARISGEALATVNVATGGLLSLLAMISLGLGSASAILVAQAVGTRDPRRTRRVGWTAIGVNTVVFVAIGILCVALADAIAAGFTSNDAIASLFAGTMWMVAILMTPDCGQMIIDPSLRASGDHVFPTVARIGAFVFVAPALGLWLVEHEGFGVEGVFAALIAASSVAYLLLMGRWAHRTSALGAGPLR